MSETLLTLWVGEGQLNTRIYHVQHAWNFLLTQKAFSVNAMVYREKANLTFQISTGK